MDHIFLPQNFCGKTHMSEWSNRVPQNPTIDADVLEYLVHMLMRKYSFSDKYDNEKFGYVPFHSEHLKLVSTRYRKHIQYLKDTEVIEVNDSYSTREKFTKAYRLRPKYKYATPLAKRLTNRRLLRLHNAVSQKEAERMREAKAKYPYLVRPLKRLEIDRKAALAYVDHLAQACRFFHGEKAYSELRWRFNLMRIQIERIAHGDISYLVDQKGRRFHSNLTSLKKELRNFLTYDGQPLGDIDIKNSQPYLSQLLLQPDFWEGRWIDNRPPSTKSQHRKKLREGKHSPETKYMQSEGKIAWNDVLQQKVDEDKVDQEADALEDTTQGRVNAGNAKTMEVTRVEETWALGINMLLRKAQMPASGGFALFRCIVNIGLYEFLIDQFPNQLAADSELKKLYVALGSPKITRDYMKKLTMVALYSKPNSRRPQSKFARRMFEHHFPEVIEVFAAIKEGKGKSYTRLPILLQRLESMLVLDRICKEFWKRYRKPVYTIHDGIVTTLPYLGKLREIAKSIITKAIGEVPNLISEEWAPSHLQDTIGDALDRMMSKQPSMPEQVQELYYLDDNEM